MEAYLNEALDSQNLRNQEEFRRREVSPSTLISNLTTDPNFYVFLGPVVYLLLFILIYTWYEVQVATLYGGERVLSQGMYVVGGVCTTVTVH